MQRYGRTFAKVYDAHWNGFSLRFAPLIREAIDTSLGRTLRNTEGRSLLDLCCGTGQLAFFFLSHDWKVTGLDLSPDMLKVAEVKNAHFRAAGQFSTICADAKDFSSPGGYLAVTSVFDALNHLDSEADLASCFVSVHAAMAAGGVFVFDLNTKKGLQDWNCFETQDEGDVYLVKRGMYVKEAGKAWLEITGFAREASGSWERFDELFYNTAFGMDRVVELLRGAGFSHVELRRGNRDFLVAEEPEKEDRIFFVARK